MPTYYYADRDIAFVRVPKTGSSSIMQAFLPEKPLPEHRIFSPIPCTLQPQKSFAFVRHPIQRLASAIAMFRARSFGAGLDLEQIFSILNDDEIGIDKNTSESLLKLHIIPMTHNHFGLEHVERIFYYEIFPQEWMRLANYLNVDPPQIMLLGPSSIGLRPNFTKAEQAKIKQVYHDDFEHFGYK